jgi:integrase
MPRKETLPSRFPVTLSEGAVRVKIYRHHKHGSDRFLLGYPVAGKRRLEWFSSYAEARRRGEAILADLGSGALSALQLTGTEREAYTAALVKLRPAGLPLLPAVEELLAARNLLNGKSLIQAAREYASRHQERIASATVAEVVEQALEAKRQDRMSERYLVQLASDWRRLAKAFSGPIDLIRTRELEDWLRSLDVAPRTRNSMRSSVVTLFSFAKQRGYLPKEFPTEAEALTKAKVVTGDISTFTPEQLRILLDKLPRDLIPFVTLGSFAGLRSAEIQKLGWEAIRFRDNLIEVKATQAKTASRRLVPLEPNLRKWLETHRHSGPILPTPEAWKGVTSLAKDLNLGWPQNVLRHSYITYRVARDKDVNRVALDCGNSPQIIFQHYRELATETQAMEWFEICP